MVERARRATPARSGAGSSGLLTTTASAPTTACAALACLLLSIFSSASTTFLSRYTGDSFADQMRWAFLLAAAFGALLIPQRPFVSLRGGSWLTPSAWL